MARPRISAFVGASLDGFLARPDGSVDWLDPYVEDNGYTAFFDSIDTLVIGRKTYYFVQTLPSWPYQGKRCIVMTHRSIAPQHDERAYAGAPGALVAQLEASGARHLYVDGGAVIRAFLAAGLLDEITVTIVPSLIGEGLSLFGGVKRESGLVLEQVQSLGGRLVQMRYRIEGGSEP